MCAWLSLRNCGEWRSGAPYGSGLGCVDWPGCSETQFVDVSTGHTAIEQINRLFTGVVSAAVAASALGSFLVSPRRRSMILLAVGLVVGVLVQVLLGAVVVLTDSTPGQIWLISWSQWS